MGVDRSWVDAFADIERWLDRHYRVETFGDASELLYNDGSGVDTANSYGPAAVRALRLAVDLSRCLDTIHGRPQEEVPAPLALP